MSQNKDFNIERGATWNTEITVLNDDGTDADLASITSVLMEIRNEPWEAEPFKMLTLTDGIVKVDNRLTPNLMATETTDLIRDHYHYRLIINFTDLVYIPISGKLLMNNGGI